MKGFRIRSHRLAIPMAGGLTLLAAVGLLFHIWRSDERVLRRRLTQLTALLEKTADEKPLAMLSRMRQVSEFLAVDIELVPGRGLPSVVGRQELLLFIQNTRSSLHTLRIRVREQTVSIAADRNSAETRAVVEISAQSGAEAALEIHEGVIGWCRTNGQWKIHRVRAADTIRNPALAE